MKEKLLFGTIGVLLGIVVLQWTLSRGTVTPAFSAPIGNWQPIVLKCKDIKNPSESRRTYVVSLLSGRTFEVPESDVDLDNSIEILEKAVADDAPRAGVPLDAEAASIIRSKCAAEWPDDFKMRKYCEDQQYEGLRALRARSMNSGDLATIRSKCAKEWPDDFRMRDYCEKQQIEALRQLGR